MAIQKTLITVRGGIGVPDVTFDHTFYGPSHRTEKIAAIINEWSQVTGLNWAHMPINDQTDQKFMDDGGEGYVQFELPSPLVNRGRTTFYFKDEDCGHKTVK